MLTVEGLVKRYGAATKKGRRSGRKEQPARDDKRVLAVAGVSFEVLEGELFTLLGPSGCGKTTTLRSIAGLEHPDSGNITLGNSVFFDSTSSVNVPVRSRGIGMVFQSYAIWPHLSVFRNVSFPLEAVPRRRRLSRSAIRESVSKVLDVTELGPYADRPATNLSGGQQQRLALARALVTEPELMLLDEPLSNLDAKLRQTMRIELKRLQREQGITSLYVTHDQNEALVLSSRIAVMKDGKIMQVGKPREIYTRPANKFVADFVGTTNFVVGTMSAEESGHYRIDTPNGAIWTSVPGSSAVGEQVTVSLRPECLKLSAESVAGRERNEWLGLVVSRAYQGDTAEHIVRVGGQELQVRSDPSFTIPPGTEVYVSVNPNEVTVVPE